MKVSVITYTPAYCNHTPPNVSAIRAAKGQHRIRCMTCGKIGPERESPGQAWLALRWLKHGRRYGWTMDLDQY